MSGKSTYLRQVALCVVTAQVGQRRQAAGLERGAELARPAIARASGAAALMSQPPVGVPGPPQVGAFVPAAFASLTPCDRLLARLGTGDSLETCSSSFMVEMQARGG